MESKNNVSVRGKGLHKLIGDSEPYLAPLKGDGGVGQNPLPGDFRMAGTKFKGLAQVDPILFSKLFA